MLTQLPNLLPQPAWWQLMQWIADPLKLQARCSDRYGNLFSLTLGKLGSFVVIGEPPMIQEVFNQDAKHFDVGRGNWIAEPLLGKHVILLMDGEQHRRERKLLMPPFHGDRLHTYADQICQVTSQVAQQWKIGEPFVMRSAMQQISLAVILQVVFGVSQGERYQQLTRLLSDWTDMIDSPLRSSMLFFPILQQDWGKWSPWGQMKRGRSQIHALLQAEIEEKRASGAQGTDILSLLMSARDDQGEAMTDAELKDELLGILFAGHETTATTLAWAFYQVHQYADVRVKLQQELASLGDHPDPLAIAQLPYLTAVCQETLRMYPVIPSVFTRIAKGPVTIGGYTFDTGTILMPSIYLVHYRDDLYPEPTQFRPERFLERQYSSSEYIPFGGGSRRCLGYALALLEIKLVLATVLRHCTLTLAEQHPIQPQRRGFTLSPTGGVPMIMTQAL
jgi:cytochrome P450 family 110